MAKKRKPAAGKPQIPKPPAADPNESGETAAFSTSVTMATLEERSRLTLIQAGLCAAVPLLVLGEFRGRDVAELAAEAPRLAQMIAEHGDHILYRSKPGKGKPGSAAAFNALARAVAIASLCPGGIKVFGLRFESAPDGDGGYRVIRGGEPA